MRREPLPDRLISKLSTETIARHQVRLGNKKRAEFILGAIEEKFGRVPPPDPFDVQTIKAKIESMAPQE